jgi:uncharacterized peroxidase-related enzyme
VLSWSGTPRNLIFQNMVWEERGALRGYDFLEGDLPFLERWLGAPGSPTILDAMATGIKHVDPAQNEFLAQLESKANRANHFFRTMAHRPEVLKNFVPLYGAIVGPGSVDRRIKELVYLTCSYANACVYCTAAHVASSKKAGVTDAEQAALAAADDAGFAPAERAAIAYARELTRTAGAAATRDGLAAHFNDEQIVEITLVAAMANFTNRFNTGLGVMPEA